jgi:hypothetical protein
VGLALWLMRGYRPDIPAGCRAGAPVRSRFARAKAKTQRHATCANRGGACHALGAQSRACRGESNALLSWVGALLGQSTRHSSIWKQGWPARQCPRPGARGGSATGQPQHTKGAAQARCPRWGWGGGLQGCQAKGERPRPPATQLERFCVSIFPSLQSLNLRLPSAARRDARG